MSEKPLLETPGAVDRIAGSLAGSGPQWLDTNTWRLNESMLFTEIIDELGLERKGSFVYDRKGQRIKKEGLRSILFTKIGTYFPEGGARKAQSLCDTLMIQIPETKAQNLEIITAAQLENAQLEKTSFVIDGILPCGLCVIAAPPKTGKSWLCLDISEKVATGREFWHRKTNGGDVLYMALEDSLHRLRERLHILKAEMPETLQIATQSQYTVTNGLIDSLQNWVNEAKNPRLIIIDTLARVKGPGLPGLDAYNSDYIQFSPVQKFALANKICVLLITHLSKQKGFALDDPFERINGSSGLFAVTDACWTISGKRGSEQELLITGRDAEYQQYKIKMENMRWCMIGSTEEVEERKARSEYDESPVVKTLRHFVENGGQWHGSTEELRLAVAEYTGTLPATSSKHMSNIMKGLQNALIENDGITFTQGKGGRAGRDYTIAKIQNPMI